MDMFTFDNDEMYMDFGDNDLFQNISSSSNDLFDPNFDNDDILNDQTFPSVNTNNCITNDITTNKTVSYIYSTDTIVPYNPFLLKNSKRDKKEQLSYDYKPESRRKRKVSLTNNQKEFKNKYYSVFLDGIKGKSVLKKDLVLKIHQSIYKKIGIRPIKRINRRCAFTYFRDFAPCAKKIISYITEHKEKLSDLINLSEIKQKKVEKN